MKIDAIESFLAEDNENVSNTYEAMLNIIVKRRTEFLTFNLFAETVVELPHREHSRGSSTSTFRNLKDVMMSRFSFTELEATIILVALTERKFIFYNDKDDEYFFYR